MVSVWFLALLFMTAFVDGVSARSRFSTLLIATTTDPASINLARNLLKRNSWEALKPVEGACAAYRQTSSLGNDVYLWLQNHPLLKLDNGESIFKSSYHLEQVSIHNAIFLSKHFAASGKRSLTVHPIGVPWLADPGKYGGKGGRCSPPNARISELYRSILKIVNEMNASSEFQVTKEILMIFIASA